MGKVNNCRRLYNRTHQIHKKNDTKRRQLQARAPLRGRKVTAGPSCPHMTPVNLTILGLAGLVIFASTSQSTVKEEV